MAFLKLLTVEELFGKKPKKRKFTIWRYTDILLCFLLAFPMSFVGLAYAYYHTIWLISMPLLFVLWLAKPLYDRNRPTPKGLRYVTGILRTVLYVIAGIAILIPHTMGLDWKWYYPVQRTVYLSNYSEGSVLEMLLPETLPEEAEHYEVTFIPKVMQGSATVDIRFYTDAASIQNYRAYAERCGAEHYDIQDEKVQKWKNFMESSGANTDGAEVMIFKSGYSNTAVWMLNERTGYFHIYW